MRERETADNEVTSSRSERKENTARANAIDRVQRLDRK